MSGSFTSDPASLPPETDRPRNGRPHRLPVFLLALLIGVGAHVGALALFRLELPEATRPKAARPFVRYTKTDDVTAMEVTREEEKIFDPEPLYLPTSWNFASQEIKPDVAKPPPVFGRYAVQPAPSKGDFRPQSSRLEEPGAPDDALKPGRWDMLDTIGLAHSPGQPLPTRGARLRILPLDSRSGHAQPALPEITWDQSMAPPAGNASWKPASFSLMFDAAGLVAEPALESSSGLDAVDESLLANLRKWFSRHSLPPGYYEVEIAP